MVARIEHLVTSGTFRLDGGTWDVDNNVWLVGDDDEVVVIDAAQDASAIASAVGERRLVAIVCATPRLSVGLSSRVEGRFAMLAPGLTVA